jgi:hypothetical protein
MIKIPVEQTASNRFSKGEILNKNSIHFFPRRDFLFTAPALLFGSRLSNLPLSSGTQERKILPSQLSPEEKKQVESSVMAQDLLDFFGQGYSCAESLLTVSLRRMNKNKDLVWAAAGFGGGMYHRDLCGFLTAGVMALGFSAGRLKMERADAKKVCEQSVESYWNWWTSEAPLHCSEIRTEKTSSEVCRRLGQLAAVKIEGLILSGDQDHGEKKPGPDDFPSFLIPI